MTSYFSRLAPESIRPKLTPVNVALSSSSLSSGTSSSAPLPSPSRPLFGRAPSATPSHEESYEHRDIEENQIRCSDCGTFMDVMHLGEHICVESELVPTGVASQVDVPTPPRHELAKGAPRRQEQQLRVDVTAASNCSSSPHSASLSSASARSYASSGGPYSASASSGYLNKGSPTTPFTPFALPTQPATPQSPEIAGSLARSASSQSISSASSNKLPFFEKYQRLVTPSTQSSTTALASPAMSRSGTSDSLDAQANSRRTPLSVTPTRPSPPTSSSAFYGVPHSQSSLSVASSTGLSASRGSDKRGPSPQPSQRSYRSNDSRSSDNRSQRNSSNETPASSILSSSPPRSKRIAIDERELASEPLPLDHDDFYAAYDDERRATLKASHSAPNQLASFLGGSAAGFTSTQTPSKAVASSSGTTSNGMTCSTISGSGLDACLEDLRLMTESDEEEEYDPLSNNYYDRRLTTSGPFDEDIERTPKLPKAFPQSRSTPALSSSTALASITGSTSSSSSSSAARSGYSASSRTGRGASPVVTPIPLRNAVPAPLKRCTTCRRDLSNIHDIQKAGDGQVFCRGCYADRFLPKCRKCSRAIEGGAVTSSDGKVLGKYHKECFTCFTCSGPFPNGDFYVFDHKPYCQMHYHKLNGSLCVNARCGQPIEGRCVSLVGAANGGGGRYHVEHFVCSHRTCGVPLLEHHFVVSGLPFCERHADGTYSSTSASSSSRSGTQRPNGTGVVGPTTRAKKRQTIITKR